MGKVIVFATPVFLLLIAIEFAWGRRKQRQGGAADTYRLNDAISSISLGMMSQLANALTAAWVVGIYSAVYASVAVFPQGDFWSTWYGVLLALVFYDFCYYWLHRAGHEVAVVWAAHVVHHQSQAYNLSTALRQTSSGALLGWLFYLPMAVAGVPPVIFGVVALIDLLYQFWVHTEHVGRLGWFDRWFCSPSNHRVHHAVNDQYLDKNYGGVLMLWDHLFGSFKPEVEPCIYGTRSPLNSWNPLWANAEVYWSLAQDSWRTRAWADKLRVWFKPPGWRAPDLQQRFPKSAFDLAQVQSFNPPMRPAVLWFGTLQFVLLMFGVLAFLWASDSRPLPESAVWCAVLATCMWALGALMQGRMTVVQALLMESAALATATSSLGLLNLHLFFKPLVMVVAIILIAASASPKGDSGQFSKILRFKKLLLAALVWSLVGDVLLMLPGDFFLPGLASFLVAHLCYIALFRSDTAQLRWFPNRWALLATLAAAAAMYTSVYAGLGDPVLKAAVAVYALVIALMAAQAIGRASALGSVDAKAVALGVCVFMLSDSLIAINKFVQPLPMAALWILSTYYVAQILIAVYARPAAQKADIT
jgi:alkylglycerol monooxygenase